MRSSARAKQRKDKGDDDINGTYHFWIHSGNLLPNWIAISHRIDIASVPCMTLCMIDVISVLGQFGGYCLFQDPGDCTTV